MLSCASFQDYNCSAEYSTSGPAVRASHNSLEVAHSMCTRMHVHIPDPGSSPKTSFFLQNPPRDELETYNVYKSNSDDKSLI